MSNLFKRIMVFIGILIIGFIGDVVYRTQKSSVTTVPHVFYSSMKVTNIDSVGNVSGKTSVYRVDGMKGKPILVTDLPGLTNSIEFQPASLRYRVFTQPSSNVAQTSFPVTITGSGDEIQETHPWSGANGNFKNQILTQRQWIHPDGTYATQAEQYCTETPSEGPCMSSYRLKVTDLATSVVKEYAPKDFGTDEGGFVPTVLAPISPTSVLVSIDSVQELNMVFLGTINFGTGLIQSLLKSDATTLIQHGYRFLRLSDDHQSAIFLDQTPTNSPGSQLISMNLENGTTRNISQRINSLAVHWNHDTSEILYETADGKSVVSRVIATGKEKTIARTSLSQYIDPQRFTVDWKTSSGGVEGGKLVITDQKTRRQRVIYDQLQASNAYQTVNQNNTKPAAIGDVIYGFIGIEQ